MLNRDARPGAWQRGAGERQMASVTTTRQQHSTTMAVPLALEIFKRERWCMVAKVTNLDGEPILAIAHRNQHGVKNTISVPLAALDYAERAGCRRLYFRRDQTGQMWRLPLADLRRPPAWMATSDGVAECFVKISAMQRVPWRKWEYAAQVVRLGEEEPPNNLQLTMFGEVAV